MKKKILSIALVVAMVAILAAGSFAYFTDKDSATNTFTAGGVDIALIEQQGNADHTDFVPYVNEGKVLMPIVGSAQGEKYDNGQPKAENYIDKVVTVENTGKSGAWVRAYFAIPSALDDGYETFNAGANILHFNFGNDNGVSTIGNQWNWMHDGKWNYFETTIDNVPYNVYYADYYQVLPKGETTEQFVSGVYLDKSFDCKDGKYYAFGQEVNLSGLMVNGELTVNCPVYAVAVQADGFKSVDEAVTAAFGAHFNPWGGAATNWQ